MTEDLAAALRAQLRAAMVARDRPLVSAFRTALAALANAEAVQGPEQPSTEGDRHFAGSVSGLGAAETSRRVLSGVEARKLITAEVEDLRHAADNREGAGLTGEAEGLRRAAAALEATILS